MKSKIKITLIISLMAAVCLTSCDGRKDGHNELSDSIEAKINDSLSVKIFFNEDHHNFSTIIIKNQKSNVNHIYSFHNDGITPNIVGREKEGKRVGLYYTFYPSGRLNNRINYLDGEFNGDYVSYSANGQIQYKAIFEKGVEKKVLVNDSSSIIQIQE
jgi:antitoxin component YwqK of YwqJK toxin-antitoxin module